jgi:MoaA/NifB/PqqE/SkfB family radical SAM enzyme
VIYFIVSLSDFNAGDFRIHFGGGEPLLKDGILDLVAFASQKGFTTVMVSNGFLIDERMAKRIAGSGLDVISISLDSLDAHTHDFLRGQKGAHQRAIEAIGYLNKHRAKSVSLLSVIMGLNLDHLIELTDWANEQDLFSSIYFQAISQPIATPKDKQWYRKEEFEYLWPHDNERLNHTLDRLIAYKRKGYKIANSPTQLEMFKAYFKEPEDFGNDLKCDQGDYIVYFRPNGDVMLCGAMSSIGNLRNNTIKNIWHSQEAYVRRQQIYNCKDSCLNVINCFVNKELL